MKNKNEDQVSEDIEEARGALLIEVLNLQPDPENPSRVFTTWGNKTKLGLYRTVKRIIEEGK
jgi:hypothetical protein